VNFTTVHGQRHVLSSGEAGFEDGTLNYLSIPAVEIGLRHLARVGIETIQTRVNCLTEWLLTELLALRHGNGREMVRIYGPGVRVERGGTITMNFYDPGGLLLDYRRIEELAGHEGLSLRTGCFCNPGAGETAEGLTDEDMRAAFASDSRSDAAGFLSSCSSTTARAPARSACRWTGQQRIRCRAFSRVRRRLPRSNPGRARGPNGSTTPNCRVIRDGS